MLIESISIKVFECHAHLKTINAKLMRWDTFVCRLIFGLSFFAFLLSGIISLFYVSSLGIARFEKPADLTSHDAFGFYPFFIIANTTYALPANNRTIFDLPELLHNVSTQDESRYQLFFQVHKVSVISLPAMEKNGEISTWTSSQTIVRIRNRATKQITSFNNLTWSQENISKLNPNESSGADPSGECTTCNGQYLNDPVSLLNISGKTCVVRPPRVKLSQWHATIIPKQHNSIATFRPLDFQDYLDVTYKWFRAVRTLDPKMTYPSLIWDSRTHHFQAHNKLHIFIQDEYFGGSELEILRGVQYELRWAMSNYWSDFAESHRTVGLAVQHDKCMLVSSLTPQFMRELYVISPTGEESCFADLLHVAIQALKQDLYFEGFVLKISFDLFNPMGRSAHYPAVAKLIMTCRDTELSGMELVGIGSQTCLDPYVIMSAINSSLATIK